MSFGSDMNKFCREAIAKTDEQRRTITLSVLNGVINDTPVLNGFLRGAWQTTESTPATDVINRADKAGGIPRNEMLNVLVGTKGRDCVLYFVNNMPYAYEIEFEGKSRKAPDGMVRKNIARVNSIVARVASGGR